MTDKEKPYDNKTWGLYINPWEALYNTKLDNIKSEKKHHSLSEEEKFAVYWCYNRAMDYVAKYSPNDPVYGSRYDLDLIVNGVNISETIKNLLERLVV